MAKKDAQGTDENQDFSGDGNLDSQEQTAINAAAAQTEELDRFLKSSNELVELVRNSEDPVKVLWKVIEYAAEGLQMLRNLATMDLTDLARMDKLDPILKRFLMNKAQLSSRLNTSAGTLSEMLERIHRMELEKALGDPLFVTLAMQYFSKVMLGVLKDEMGVTDVELGRIASRINQLSQNWEPTVIDWYHTAKDDGTASLAEKQAESAKVLASQIKESSGAKSIN